MSERAFPRGSNGRVARLTEHDLRHEAICFADEILVGFPSMARAVERMRRSFLVAERLAEQPTPIQISPREARQGAVIPLALPLRCTCRRCEGRGELSGGSCPLCAGRGTRLKRQDIRVSVPPGVCHGDRFHLSLTPPHDVPTRVELQIHVA